MSQSVRIYLLPLLFGALVACPALAENYCWNLPAGEGWANNPLLWYAPDGSNGVIPGVNDYALLKSPGVMKIDASHVPFEWIETVPLRALHVGDGPTEGYLTTGSQGHVQQTGGDLYFNEYLIIGAQSPGTSTYEMTGGLLKQVDHWNDDLTLHVAVRMIVGNLANATMDVSGNSAIIVREVRVGDSVNLDTGSDGTLNLRGDSTLTVSATYNSAGGGVLEVGRGVTSSTTTHRARGTMNLHDDAVLTTNGSTVIGAWNFSEGEMNLYGRSTLNVEGGANLSIGNAHDSSGTYQAGPGGTGLMTVNDNATVNVSGTLFVGVYKTGHGTLTIGSTTGTAVVNAANLVYVGHGSTYGGGDGTLNLDAGGVLVAPTVCLGRYEGQSTLNFDGGTLRATAGGRLIYAGGVTAPSTVVKSGGAVLDSNGFDVLVDVPLLDGGGGGGLTKRGDGTLILAKPNAYTGVTAVEAGTLAVKSTSSLATSGLQISGGATLSLPGAAALTGSITNVSLADTARLGLPLTETPAGANTIATNMLNLTGGTSTLVVGAQGASVTTGSPYTVMAYNTLTGSGTLGAVTSMRGLTAATTVGGGKVDVTLSGILASANLVWSGAGSVWDTLGAMNWTNSGLPDQFHELDNVTFNNDGLGQPNVELVGRLHPKSIAVNNSFGDYTFSGAGDVVGEGTTLTKSGSAKLTIDNTGDFNITGAVSLSKSVLSMGSNRVLTTLPGPVSLAGDYAGEAVLDTQSGATLVLTGVVSDNGVNGLTKTGAGTLVLSNPANIYSGPTNINGGILQASTLADGGAPSSIGRSDAAAANLQLGNGGTLHYTGPDAATNRGFRLTGTGFGTIRTDNHLTMTGQITSPDTGEYLYKTGPGTLTLNAAGQASTLGTRLYVNGGTMVLTGGAGTTYKMGATSGYTYVGTYSGSNGTLIVEDADVDFGSTLLTVAHDWGSVGELTLKGTTTAKVGTSGARIAYGSSTNTGPAAVGTLNLEDSAQLVLPDDVAGRPVQIGSLGAHGTLNMSGTSKITAERLNVGITGGAVANLGTVNMSEDATVNASGYVIVSAYVGGNGVVNMTDNATINLSDKVSGGHVYFGLTCVGSAALNMSGNSRINVPVNKQGYFGQGRTATGGRHTADIVMRDTAKLDFDAGVYLALSLADTTMTLHDNAVVDAGTLFVGWGTDANATAVLNHTSSIITTADKNGRGSTGNVTIGGGAPNSTGSLTLNDSATMTVGGNLSVGTSGDGASGELALNGSSTASVAGTISLGSDVSSGQLNFNGGTLRATAVYPDFIVNANTVDPGVVVQSGGAKINTNGFNVGINVALTGDDVSTGGGLTKLGEGTLTLGGANTYTGDTIILGGVLSTTSDEMLADEASVRISAGATLDLNFFYSDFDTVGRLYLDGVLQATGTWGSSLSGATYTNDDYFTGTGHLLVQYAAAMVPGDANNDGKVDDDDAKTLAANWGQNGGWIQGDFNNDGVINALDAAILAANWGYDVGGESNPVPEPGMLALLLGLALAGVSRPARRQR